ncbi:MAG TPA: O-antigen ligase family protein [Polyangiaceae bacterium]
MKRGFVFVLIWLSLTAEVEGTIFEGKWSTPLTTLGTFLFKGLPGIHIVPWDALLMLALALTLPGAAKGRIRAVVRSIQLSFAALAALWVWGVLRGGSAYQTIWQLHAFVMGLFVALLVANTCRTLKDVEALGKVLLFACLYRCLVLLVFYFSVAKGHDPPLPTLTDHCDSVLFVTGLYVAVIAALERRTPKAFGWAALTAVLVFTAIALNGRRIGWLGVAVGAGMVYLLMPAGKVKRGLTKLALALSPLLVVYVVVGWGNPSGIFKPVGSISTMFGSNQDTSSVMRDIENYNLMKTLKTNPLLGTGWGHEYVEEVMAYDIASIFPQYRYLPHNSLLGALAFTGIFGFAGLWQVVPVASYLHGRTCWFGENPKARTAALASLIAMIIITIQMWGDVGFNHIGVNTLLGVAIGLSARLPSLSGAWPPPATAVAGAQMRGKT